MAGLIRLIFLMVYSGSARRTRPSIILSDLSSAASKTATPESLAPSQVTWSDVQAIQKSGGSVAEFDFHTQDQSCSHSWAVQATFRSAGILMKSGVLGKISDTSPALQEAGWIEAQHYESSSLFNTDRAELWVHSEGDCILAFRGGTSVSNAISLMKKNSTSFYGLQGVRTGVAEMVDRLIKVIQSTPVGLFPTSDYIERFCTRSFDIAGQSMGGAAASIFAAVINHKSYDGNNLLNWPRRVDRLFTYGAVPSALQPLRNDQSDDGCFDGASYYTKRDSKVDEEFNDGRESAFTDAMIGIVFVEGPFTKEVVKCCQHRGQLPLLPHLSFPDGHMPDDYRLGLGC